MSTKKIMISWSTGKDSAWMLHQLQQNSEGEIAGLFCSVNLEFERTAMHAVRLDLLHRQARAAGLPLEVVGLPWPCSNAEYERIMAVFFEKLLSRGITHIAFGDLFLEDVRAYRCRQLAGSGIEPLFPLWQHPTGELSRLMLEQGMRAVVTCIDPRCMPEQLAGRFYDEALIASLPKGIDPCGENGEFHTFVFGGPMFRQEIEIRTGETVHRDGFVFTDVLPA